jgi:transposase
LKTLAKSDKINLYYFDESGFSTLPSVPYAWQPVGTTRELPSFYSKRLNLLGFMSHKGQAVIYPTEGSVNTEQVILAFDRFTSNYEAEYRRHQKPCVVTLDNASFHTSKELHKHIDKWGARGVILHYLPPYSPELNLIEILWRKMKYEWLPLSCYSDYANLKVAVLDIIEGLGSIYQITFV